MSQLVQARLVNGPFDDPGLYLDFRFGRRGILFDLGDLTPLSAREIMRVSHAFVSHAHLDHIAGFDRLLRTCLHRTGPLALVGPPGFIDQIDCRLRSYTWNLLDQNSVDFRLRVEEFDGERLTRAAVFPARRAFAREQMEPPGYSAGVVLSEDSFTIDAVSLDHGTPSLAFALRERMRVNVWRTALDDLGLPVGPWLNEAKTAVRGGFPDDHVIDIPGHRGFSLGELRLRILRTAPGQVVAYVTDTSDSAENRARIMRLAEGADTLFIEAAFLEADRPLAEATHHLTAKAAGEIARHAGVPRLIGFHHSARYIADPEIVPRELAETFGRTHE